MSVLLLVFYFHGANISGCFLYVQCFLLPSVKENKLNLLLHYIKLTKKKKLQLISINISLCTARIFYKRPEKLYCSRSFLKISDLSIKSFLSSFLISNFQSKSQKEKRDTNSWVKKNILWTSLQMKIRHKVKYLHIYIRIYIVQ